MIWLQNRRQIAIQSSHLFYSLGRLLLADLDGATIRMEGRMGPIVIEIFRAIRCFEEDSNEQNIILISPQKNIEFKSRSKPGAMWF